MLGKFKSFSSFSVSNAQEAKNFYADKLGLTVIEDMDMAFLFQTGGETKFMIYEKDNHSAANYTVMVFEVGSELESTIKTLNEKGIIMEQYPEMNTNELGIAPAGKDGEERMAWFKDPSGNILGLMGK